MQGAMTLPGGERRHSVKSVAVAYCLRSLYPDYYPASVPELALMVAADRCAPGELRAANTDAELLSLARLAHERETR